MRKDTLDILQALGLTVTVCWSSVRRMRQIGNGVQKGTGSPRNESPFRKDTVEERRFRMQLLIVFLLGSFVCLLVCIFPKLPGVKQVSLYQIGLFVYLGLAAWHFLYLKGVIKKRTLWSGYVEQDSWENRVKERLVLRAHERGERIPTEEEVHNAAKMSEAEFRERFAKS